MNYKALVEDYRERLIDDLMGLLEIKSVKGEPTGQRAGWRRTEGGTGLHAGTRRP